MRIEEEMEEKGAVQCMKLWHCDIGAGFTLPLPQVTVAWEMLSLLICGPQGTISQLGIARVQAAAVTYLPQHTDLQWEGGCKSLSSIQLTDSVPVGWLVPGLFVLLQQYKEKQYKAAQRFKPCVAKFACI